MAILAKVEKSTEINIFSKEALSLPKKERIKLILSLSKIPVVTKRTAIEKQVREIISLHDFVNMLFVKIFPTEERDAEYINFAFARSFLDDLSLPELNSMEIYESFDRMNEKISNYAYDVFQKYPDVYDEFDLDEIFSMSALKGKIEFFREKYNEIGNEAFEKEILKYLE